MPRPMHTLRPIYLDYWRIRAAEIYHVAYAEVTPKQLAVAQSMEEEYLRGNEELASEVLDMFISSYN